MQTVKCLEVGRYLETLSASNSEVTSYSAAANMSCLRKSIIADK